MKINVRVVSENNDQYGAHNTTERLIADLKLPPVTVFKLTPRHINDYPISKIIETSLSVRHSHMFGTLHVFVDLAILANKRTSLKNFITDLKNLSDSQDEVDTTMEVFVLSYAPAIPLAIKELEKLSNSNNLTIQQYKSWNEVVIALTLPKASNRTSEKENLWDELMNDAVETTNDQPTQNTEEKEPMSNAESFNAVTPSIDLPLKLVERGNFSIIQQDIEIKPFSTTLPKVRGMEATIDEEIFIITVKGAEPKRMALKTKTITYGLSEQTNIVSIAAGMLVNIGDKIYLVDVIIDGVRTTSEQQPQQQWQMWRGSDFMPTSPYPTFPQQPPFGRLILIEITEEWLRRKPKFEMDSVQLNTL